MHMRIGVFSDSINIPPKEGINVHTYELINNISTKLDGEVLLIVADRGWLDKSVLKNNLLQFG